MNFSCKVCEYNTEDKSNYNKHLQSKKHLNNIEKIEKNEKPSNYLFACNNCNSTYKNKSGLKRHLEKCKKPEITNQNNLNNLSNLNNNINVSELLLKIRQLEYENENLSNQCNRLHEDNRFLTSQLISEKDKLLTQTSNNADILNDEVVYLKSLCKGATTLVSDTMNTVNFIMNNLTTAPAIDKNVDYKKILYDNNTKEKIDIIEELVHHYRHKSLTKYIGDMIVKCYKKDDPKKQSIWNSDIARKNYLLREIINKNPEWITDKKGVKTKEIIIEPIIKLIDSLIKDFLQQNDKNKDGSFNMLLVNKKMEFGIELNKILFSIEHDNLQNDINSYIAKFFYFNKKAFIETNKVSKKSKKID